ncbi:hypothetical protein K445DRAFT_319570 [Daldinia sp. EC12]|nr:hypothetical protein F4774DRAFT_68457 [Daldinia eschscholtzii]OTB14029.1 hypothetical protein K445DRAFT_319570 [Daldinia sp. EC12]
MPSRMLEFLGNVSALSSSRTLVASSNLSLILLHHMDIMRKQPDSPFRGFPKFPVPAKLALIGNRFGDDATHLHRAFSIVSQSEEKENTIKRIEGKFCMPRRIQGTNYNKCQLCIVLPTCQRPTTMSAENLGRVAIRIQTFGLDAVAVRVHIPQNKEKSRKEALKR